MASYRELVRDLNKILVGIDDQIENPELTDEEVENLVALAQDIDNILATATEEALSSLHENSSNDTSLKTKLNEDYLPNYDSRSYNEKYGNESIDESELEGIVPASVAKLFESIQAGE